MPNASFAALWASLVVFVGCATAIQEDRGVTHDAKAGSSSNPLLAEWAGPHGGVPPFDRVEVGHFEPALETSMNGARREIAAIADQKAPPSFDNTIVALERAGRTFGDVENLYGVWSSTMSGPQFQDVERRMAPKLAAFDDEITQNAKLFARIEAVYHSPEKSKLTPEEQRLTWLTYTNFVRSGAKLDSAKKKRVAEINQRLATLYTAFRQNVLGDEEHYAVVLQSEGELAGLPPSVRAGAAAAAEARGMQGKWAITNTRSAMEPFLTYSARRELREKVWRNYVDRGDNGDARDTNEIIAEILQLRAERAKILGYPTHAHWRLENTMAKSPERAMALMEAVWRTRWPASARRWRTCRRSRIARARS